MASGIPVISSATTALPEICGDAALLVSPENINEISNAIRELDQKADVRQKLSLGGLRRAKDFDWERSADIVRKVYLGHFGVATNGS